MPKLLRFACNSCDLDIKTWENGQMYVINKKGKKIKVSHPGEAYQVAKVLKIDESEIFGFPYMHIPNPDLYPLLNERVRVMTECICLECLEKSELDYKMDEKKCNKCGTTNILPIDHLEGLKCPKCKKGTIEYHPTGIIS